MQACNDVSNTVLLRMFIYGAEASGAKWRAYFQRYLQIHVVDELKHVRVSKQRNFVPIAFGSG